MARKKRYHIYLLNDQLHTFEYVIHALMSCCDMNVFQAEQCAIIVDGCDEYKIASLTNSDALFMYKNLAQFGLNVELRAK